MNGDTFGLVSVPSSKHLMRSRVPGFASVHCVDCSSGLHARINPAVAPGAPMRGAKGYGALGIRHFTSRLESKKAEQRDYSRIWNEEQ